MVRLTNRWYGTLIETALHCKIEINIFEFANYNFYNDHWRMDCLLSRIKLAFRVPVFTENTYCKMPCFTYTSRVSNLMQILRSTQDYVGEWRASIFHSTEMTHSPYTCKLIKVHVKKCGSEGSTELHVHAQCILACCFNRAKGLASPSAIMRFIRVPHLYLYKHISLIYGNHSFCILTTTPAS